MSNDTVSVVYRVSVHNNQPYAVLVHSDRLSHYPYMDVLTLDKWPEDPRDPDVDIVNQMVHITWYRDQTRGPRHREVLAFHLKVMEVLLRMGYSQDQIRLRKKLPAYRQVFKDYETPDLSGLHAT